MAQITYVNKVALNENPNVPAINKVRDADMNEIKEVVNQNETKILLAVSDTAPSECSTGDVYFNTTTNLLYTATATDTWGTTGVAPTSNTIYLELTNQTAYAYNGTTLVSVGGGAGGGGDTTPIGTVEAYAGTTAPNGYLLCDGSAVSRTTYSDLFNVIGTTYGIGDGSTTFNLPNIKGKVVVMQDTTQTEFDTLGETGGSKDLQQHSHSYNIKLNSGSGDAGHLLLVSNSTGTEYDNASGAINNTGTGNSGNLQPYIVLNYIIKANKISEVPETATVQNVSSDSTTDTYSCDYINDCNTYSTSEVKTNKTWIDGKPIYRKVYTGTKSSGWTDITLNISNYDTIYIAQTNFIFTVGNTQYNSPMYQNTSTDFARALLKPQLSSNQMSIGCGTELSNITYQIVIEYTKTTD